MPQLLLALLACSVMLTDPGTTTGTHIGKVVAAEDGKLTIVDEVDGDNEAFAITADTKITLDGKTVELEDLSPGLKVKVTSKQRKGQTVAVEVEARSSE